MANEGRSPEAEFRRAFEARPPALGLTSSQIDALLVHSKNPKLSASQVRGFFGSIQSSMLRSLIPTSGCGTMADLCAVLHAELKSGIPALVPDWYVYSTTTMGPGKIGYDKCAARGCLNTEGVDKKFSKCSQVWRVCFKGGGRLLW